LAQRLIHAYATLFAIQISKRRKDSSRMLKFVGFVTFVLSMAVIRRQIDVYFSI